MPRKGYKRIDVTFSENNEKEMELYKWIESKGELIGNGKFIKQFLYNEMLKEKATKK